MCEIKVSLAITVTTAFTKFWALASFIVCFPHALNSLLSHHLSASVRRGVQSAHRSAVVVATLMPRVDSTWQHAAHAAHAAHETCGRNALHQQKAHCETTTKTTMATMQ